MPPSEAKLRTAAQMPTSGKVWWARLLGVAVCHLTLRCLGLIHAAVCGFVAGLFPTPVPEVLEVPTSVVVCCLNSLSSGRLLSMFVDVRWVL